MAKFRKCRRPPVLPPRLRLGRSLTRILPVLAYERTGLDSPKTVGAHRDVLSPRRSFNSCRVAAVMALLMLVLLVLLVILVVQTATAPSWATATMST